MPFSNHEPFDVDPDPGLGRAETGYAIRAAVEGLPAGAIARILQRPVSEVFVTLHVARDHGLITDMPRADWPPTSRMADRVPSHTPAPSDDDLLFTCRKALHLTKLEASFLIMLLRHDRADKTKLHHIIETLRLQRAQQPNHMEATDPKMVDVMICKLRKKLRDLDAEFVITTVWGGGYYVAPTVKQAILERLGVTHGNGHAERAPADVGPAPIGGADAGDHAGDPQTAGA